MHPGRLARRCLWLLLPGLLAGCDWRSRVDPEAVAADPIQLPLEDAEPIELELRGYRVKLSPRASFELTAYVAETSRWVLDEWDFVMPLDLTLIWGAAARPELLEKLSFELVNRRVRWSCSDCSIRPGDPRGVLIGTHLANVHVIPGSPALERLLGHVKVGDLVRLRGKLVDVSIHDAAGKRVREVSTSLSRNDTGDGACEVLWVEDLDRL